MHKVTAIIPTYNEKENLKNLIEQIFALNIQGLSVLVVDDNSPDGTGKLADELAQKYPLEILHREKKEGIGKAYIAAFRKVLAAEEKPDFIIQMDADLSHDPAIIPMFLEKIRECDLVLGSRYIPGGKIVNWDKIRQAISRFGNFYARAVLGLPYKDITGGFKCFRREVLESIDINALNSIGYCFQIETTFLARQKGFKICEVPITFTERKFGVSKFNFGIMLESFIKVFLMRFNG